ncbi:hypothetical protein FNV43_RR06661 [Rhamnella rubrinervis]|uniref:Methyltransferase type 12 domain-containing protein n=1 Tax=Rhamnella rubrinervis TaxID=2594499 RepID=A0A8K0HDC7_9ROSA|nr:hypothetical protein FNV43_RR06661 [Rhamnella rubrinervis]
MRGGQYPTVPHSPSISHVPSFTASITTIRRLHRHSHPTALKARCYSLALEDHYQKKATKYWDEFYKRHQNKFFKDRHYLERDWGCYFAEEDVSPKRKVVLEVGCGSGSTLFPLVAAFPNLYVHACDFSPKQLILLRDDRVNPFVADVTDDALCDHIDPSSVDVVTLIFMLSAVSPKKMPFILQNIKSVMKLNGYVLLRDYAVGDFAQVKLQNKNQMIGVDFYVRGDGTCSFYFSEDFLSTLFLKAGFNTLNMNTYCRQIHNSYRKITMNGVSVKLCKIFKVEKTLIMSGSSRRRFCLSDKRVRAPLTNFEFSELIVSEAPLDKPKS